MKELREILDKYENRIRNTLKIGSDYKTATTQHQMDATQQIQDLIENEFVRKKELKNLWEWFGEDGIKRVGEAKDFDKAAKNLGYISKQSLLSKITDERIAFSIFVALTGYTEKLAREEWTGKHYQNKNKNMASKLAKTILAEIKRIIDE